ncbi:MAG TPA: pilus assembly protein TadG-related protein [Allosphingosinicella sp.]|jgi:Flp pilus assembly protein TadG
MKAMQRLKAFMKSERGNVLAMGAAAMPMLLASAGFAVDTIQLAMMKRQMQRAADSAAIAGAYAVTQAPTTTSEQSFASSAGTIDIAKNKTPTLIGVPSIVAGPSLGYAKTVKVDLAAKPRLPFMAIFTRAPTNVTATATAALVSSGRFCLLSLYNDDDRPGIAVTGNATVNLGCGMATNARGTNAVSAGGSSTVTASPIMAPGGLQASTSYTTGTKLQPYSAEQTDPFAHIGLPSFDVSNCPALEIKKNDPVRTVSGGCYSSMDIKGAVTFTGEVVVYGGNINFGAGAEVTGTGVTFFLTGPGGAAGSVDAGIFDTDGHPQLNLTAPSSGTYKDILFYRDRRAAQADMKLNGNAQSTLSGAFYFPTADVTVNGNAGFKAECFQMVVRRAIFSGNERLNNSCTRAGGPPSFQLQYVRLVK